VTSGNIQMGPGPDDVLEALKKALDDDPTLRDRPEEEVSTKLQRDGYLEQEPDPVLVAEMIAAIEGDGPGEETEAASPT
jgi:hypothetical protein